MKLIHSLVLFACFLSPFVVSAQTWQEEFSRMPLLEKTPELNRHNCVRIVLNSFQKNSAVQALIFMPGATDEFYFFRRAHAKLSNTQPTLLEAITALTNQTYIRATLNPPFLLLHTAEDSLEPIIQIKDAHTAERIRKKHFEKHEVFDDRDWDYIQPLLDFDLDTKMLPGLMSHESHHFFRHSFAEYGLNGWDTLRAVGLAGKTCFIVDKKRVTFVGDTRVKTSAIPPTTEYLNDKN